MKENLGRAYWQAEIAMTAAAATFRRASSLTQPYEDSPIDLTVFVSCYNEAQHLVETLDTIDEAAKEAGISFEIIVIDDRSKDDSAQIVREYIASHPNVNIVLRVNQKNRGLAQNYIDCAFFGTGKYYRLVCGDHSEPKETLVAVFKAIGEADCIVPYHVASPGRSAWRLFLSKAYTFLINSITGNRIRYYNGLAVHLRHNVLRWHTNTKGFGFQAEILCLLLDLGFTYREIPVATTEVRAGKSNALNPRNMLSVAHTIIEIANRRISSFVYSSRWRGVEEAHATPPLSKKSPPATGSAGLMD